MGQCVEGAIRRRATDSTVIRSHPKGPRQTRASVGVRLAGVIGIDLSSSTNYGSTRVLKYRLVANGQACGSNAPPSIASDVKTSR